jgi:ATP-dependent RNA helicase DDX23/PRP28
MKRTREERDNDNQSSTTLSNVEVSSSNNEQPQQPVYLTKQQRAILAKQERMKAQEEKRLKMEKLRKERENAVNRQLEQQQNSTSMIANEELKDIQAEYLGLKKPNKRKLKSSDRHKLAFGWNEKDDTSRDLNPLYDKKFEPSIMFGRGRLAGVDTAEQRKSRQAYDELLTARLQNEAQSAQQQLVALQESKRQKKKRRLDIANGSISGKHWTDKTLSEMDSRDWRIFREDFEITVKGGKVPNPIRNWDESPLPDEIVQTAKRLNFEKPTPIQMQCIPIGLENRDLIGLAETGSGKTLAYLLPMLVHIAKLPRLNRETAGNGPYAVVLVPVRELAQQIEQAAREFAKELGIRVLSIVGGVSIEQQMFLMREGCEIIIGTPGRLIDCLENRYIVFNQCNYVVLDEADKMIDMDFETDINRILEEMPASNLRPEDELEETSNGSDNNKEVIYRQTTMFSATMPLELEQIATKYLRRRIVVTIGEVGKAVQRIEQSLQYVKSENEKMRNLINILEQAEPPVIIFFNTKKDVDTIAKILDRQKGFRVTAIHGGKSQEIRGKALEGFKQGKFEVLCATDVIGRGIDIKGITHVINYELPKKISIYTHRIGRTGRAGKTGIAISFLTESDAEIASDLKKMLVSTGNLVPLELEELISKANAEKSKDSNAPPSLQRKDQTILK